MASHSMCGDPVELQVDDAQVLGARRDVEVEDRLDAPQYAIALK